MSPAKKRKPSKTPAIPTPQNRVRTPISKPSLHQEPAAQIETVLRNSIAKETPSERAKWESLFNDLAAMPQGTERDNRALEGFREWRTSK